MKKFVEIIKWIPYKLKIFNLDLSKNYLESSTVNLEYIGKGMKYLSKSLEDLRLDLSSNEIGIIS